MGINVLLIDKRERGNVLKERLEKKGEVTYIKEIKAIDEIDTKKYDVIFIHGSDEQDMADKFIEKNLGKPTVIYGGGEASVKGFRKKFDRSVLDQHEKKSLFFFLKAIGTGHESYFRVEKFLEKWINQEEWPVFDVLVGYSDRIKQGMYRINDLFLPLVIDFKGLTEVFIANKKNITQTLLDYLDEVLEVKEENHFRITFLGILYIVFGITEIDISERNSFELTRDQKKKIDFETSIKAIIKGSNFVDTKKLIVDLANLLEVNGGARPNKSDLYKLFDHFDSLLEKRKGIGIAGIDKEEIRQLFKLEGNIKTGDKNTTGGGVVDWYQKLFAKLSQLVEVIDES